LVAGADLGGSCHPRAYRFVCLPKIITAPEIQLGIPENPHRHQNIAGGG
jgi:hypothetical protein